MVVIVGIRVGLLVFHGVTVDVIVAVRVVPGSDEAVEVTVIVAVAAIGVVVIVAATSDAAQLVSAREMMHTMAKPKIVFIFIFHLV